MTTQDPPLPHLRVAQFMPHYPAREGSAAYCRGLSTAMEKIQPGSCPIISFKRKLPEEYHGADILHYPTTSRNPFHLPAQLKDDLRGNVHGLDGVVLHCNYNPRAAMLRRFLQRIGMPYVFVPHDPYVPELRNHHRLRKWLFWHLFEKPTIEGARGVQLLSESHEKPLRDLGCSAEVKTIPNGCEIETLQNLPDDPKTPGSGDEVRIQFLGRLDRNHKGLDILIEGFARYIRGGAEERVFLYLTGNDWEDREVLEALAAREGVSDKVVFTGQRPEHSMEILSEADIVVLSSRFDGFGLCVVEGMLAARPILVSDKAGVSEYVAKAGGGWLFNPDPAALGQAIGKAMSQRERWAGFGLRNQAFVKENLTWDQTAALTMAAYRDWFGQEANDDR